MRVLRHGDPNIVIKKRGFKSCTNVGCEEKHYAKGFCHRCYISRVNDGRLKAKSTPGARRAGSRVKARHSLPRDIRNAYR